MSPPLHHNHQLRMEALVIYYIVPHTLLPGVQVSCSALDISMRSVMLVSRPRSQSGCIAAALWNCSACRHQGEDSLPHAVCVMVMINVDV
jgi:hypothetical protein